MYRGLRTSGFSIVDKKTSYLPFKINLSLEKVKVPRDAPASGSQQGATPTQDAPAAGDAQNANTEEDADSSEYFLLAYAVPISSAYKSMPAQSRFEVLVLIVRPFFGFVYSCRR